jgi:Permuted papain-like amidase enzyme, YaeF/YiiX, C92 family
MGIIDTALDRIGHWIASRATDVSSSYEPYLASRPEFVARVIQPGDVLLIEGGRSKVSSAVKYLTQSTWSHAALYIGETLGQTNDKGQSLTLIEAELGVGIIASPLEKYASFNSRICRPVGLTPQDRDKLIRYAIKRLGGQYDMKNILDLMRYLLPNPPVPQRFRRRLISLGSGQPTRAICSTLIARAFEKVRYPILPRIEQFSDVDGMGMSRRREILHIRDSSLFTPRDFDVSPFFKIIKPTIELGFDYTSLVWSDQNAGKPPLLDKVGP